MGFTSARPAAVLGALRVRGSRVQLRAAFGRARCATRELRSLRGLAPLDRLRRSPALRAARVKSRRPSGATEHESRARKTEPLRCQGDDDGGQTGTHEPALKV